MEKTSFSLEEQRELLRFVRAVIAAALEQHRPPEPPADIPDLNRLGSCFVTLHTADGNLRGCIGNISATESLGDNLRHNAVNAAFRDPRFVPISHLRELDRLRIEISVLTPMEEIAAPEQFVVGRHGIVMTARGRSAVFLPQVAPEQGWDREETLRNLGLKAGLNPSVWQEPGTRFYVFEAIVFSEDGLPE